MDVRKVPVEEFYRIANWACFRNGIQRSHSKRFMRMKGDESRIGMLHFVWINCARYRSGLGADHLKHAGSIIRHSVWTRQYSKSCERSINRVRFEQANLSRIAVDNSDGVIDLLYKSEVSATIDKCLSGLTYRQREVLKLRYGLADGNSYTLEQCGRVFRISRERVRQIHDRAMQKLQTRSNRTQSKLRKLFNERFGIDQE